MELQQLRLVRRRNPNVFINQAQIDGRHPPVITAVGTANSNPDTRIHWMARAAWSQNRLSERLRHSYVKLNSGLSLDFSVQL